MDAVPTNPLVVTVAAGAHSTSIQLVGAVDLRGAPALTVAIEGLSRSDPETVVVDLTAVTFVCSTFANFVAGIHAALPDAALLLHNPSKMARRVLAVTGLETAVTMRDEPATPGRSR